MIYLNNITFYQIKILTRQPNPSIATQPRYTKEDHSRSSTSIQYYLTCTIKSISCKTTVTNTNVGAILISTCCIIITAMIINTIYDIYKKFTAICQSLQVFQFNTKSYFSLFVAMFKVIQALTSSSYSSYHFRSIQLKWAKIKGLLKNIH